MSDHRYLTNQLLIAMPSLADPNFSQTVTLVCEHSESGALGIVLNRPLEMRLGEVLDQLSLPNKDPKLAERAVLRGGPVQPDRGFVLHRPAGRTWDSTLEVSDTLQSGEFVGGVDGHDEDARMRGETRRRAGTRRRCRPSRPGT